MLAIYACAALILAASLLLGRAILDLLDWPRPAWLAGATGFAALVVVAPFAIRLPGRGLTAAIVIAVLCALAALRLARRPRPQGGVLDWPVGVAVVAIALALATLPFLFNERVGVLGEGIYTNDHAAQLYWAEWLRSGFGPEPSAVRFGYPIGPQAVAVIAAEVTGSSLVSAFNGLLLAIPALTGLAALAALGELAAGAADRGRVDLRPALPRRLLPRPERLQGDRDGALRARLRDRARQPRPGPGGGRSASSG